MAIEIIRLLVIDDQHANYDNIRKALDCDADTEEFLLAPATKSAQSCKFVVDFAISGEVGVERICTSMKDGSPYALATVDMRMGAGMDGLATAKEILKIDPDMQIIFCTAYSQYRHDELSEAFGDNQHQWLIIKKPFDIVALTQMVYALARKRSEMNRLKTLLRELEIARDAAQEASRVKTNFLATMSHEVRTPVHIADTQLGQLMKVFGVDPKAITAATEPDYAAALETMFEQFVAQTSEAAKQPEFEERLRKLFSKIPKRIASIKFSNRRLSYLLGDILDLAKLESCNVPFSFRRENIVTILDVAKSECESAYKDVTLELEIKDGNTHAEIDAEKIRRVFTNLVCNAMKFSRKGSIVTIRFTADAEFVMFSISDLGPGVPTDELELIFGKFFQSTRTTGSGGTGLGLTICKEYIRGHRGNVWAENNASGIGSTFYVKIPREQPNKATKCS